MPEYMLDTDTVSFSSATARKWPSTGSRPLGSV
jgi:hypothetical protein